MTPSALLEDGEDGTGEALSEIYGLMQACGSQSVEHEGLKRSARHSMILLKYLVCDFVEMENGQRINNTSIEDGGDVRLLCFVFYFVFVRVCVCVLLLVVVVVYFISYFLFNDRLLQ